MKILVAGDFCPIERTASIIEEGKFDQIFKDVKHLTSTVDYSIVNLECPIIHENAIPIVKCGPNLRCSRKVIDALCYSGFGCTTLANNHFRDFGDNGCLTTISELNNYGIDYVGGGANLKDSQKVLYKTFNGHKLGIVNVCEHEASIATDANAGSAPFDYVDIYNQITETRKEADYVLVIVHGGNEHYQLPSPKMKKTYRWLVDLGVDAVVNHHQHCYCGYEVYKGKPIFYGIGNFCFDNFLYRNSNWNKGFIVELTFENGTVAFELYPYTQCTEEPAVKFLNDIEKKGFQDSMQEFNKIISSDKKLDECYKDFCQEMSVEWLYNLEPYKRNKILLALYRRNILPSFISMDKVKWLINFIECESQVSRLLYALYSKIK